WALRRAVPALALLMLAAVTTLPASAQYGPAYYPPGPSYYGNNGNGMWNNASYYVYQNNRNRSATTSDNTDFSFHTIPPAVPTDSTADGSDKPNDGRMYLYN